MQRASKDGMYENLAFIKENQRTIPLSFEHHHQMESFTTNEIVGKTKGLFFGHESHKNNSGFDRRVDYKENDVIYENSGSSKLVNEREEINYSGCRGFNIPTRSIRQWGGKDRHSKVLTSRGVLRDRRVRLSVSTAIRFYDVQDRLGFDQPSKAIEWLMDKAQWALLPSPYRSPNNSFISTNLKAELSKSKKGSIENHNVSNYSKDMCTSNKDSPQNGFHFSDSGSFAPSRVSSTANNALISTSYISNSLHHIEEHNSFVNIPIFKAKVCKTSNRITSKSRSTHLQSSLSHSKGDSPILVSSDTPRSTSYIDNNIDHFGDTPRSTSYTDSNIHHTHLCEHHVCEDPHLGLESTNYGFPNLNIFGTIESNNIIMEDSHVPSASESSFNVAKCDGDFGNIGSIVRKEYKKYNRNSEGNDDDESINTFGVHGEEERQYEWRVEQNLGMEMEMEMEMLEEQRRPCLKKEGDNIKITHNHDIKPYDLQSPILMINQEAYLCRTPPFMQTSYVVNIPRDICAPSIDTISSSS